MFFNKAALVDHPGCDPAPDGSQQAVVNFRAQVVFNTRPTCFVYPVGLGQPLDDAHTALFRYQHIRNPSCPAIDQDDLTIHIQRIVMDLVAALLLNRRSIWIGMKLARQGRLIPGGCRLSRVSWCPLNSNHFPDVEIIAADMPVMHPQYVSAA